MHDHEPLFARQALNTETFTAAVLACGSAAQWLQVEQLCSASVPRSWGCIGFAGQSAARRGQEKKSQAATSTLEN